MCSLPVTTANSSRQVTINFVSFRLQPIYFCLSLYTEDNGTGASTGGLNQPATLSVIIMALLAVVIVIITIVIIVVLHL